jgi:SAM-dependent methyltransferase
MGKKKAMDSREVGLVMGLAAGKYFFGSDDLHYGLWTDGLAVKPENIRKAQDQHSQLLLDTIPADVKTILDVGCGAGAMAKRLVDRGYTVTCVSPSGPLTAEARKKLGPDVPILEMPFESVETSAKYDMVMFSESYQYIKLERSIEQISNLLRPGGYLMICDFFRRTAEERGPIRGGHKIEVFREIISKYPLISLVDRDITKETARNYDLMNDFLNQVGVPVWELAFRYCTVNYPRTTAIARRLFRKKIEKLEKKYFQGHRTAETFTRYKTYRLLLFQFKS